MAIVNNNKTKTASGEDLGKEQYTGTDGDTYLVAVSLEATADSQATSGAVPGKFSVKTANSSGALTEAFSVDSSQVTDFGTNTVNRTSRKLIIPVCGNAKVGATAGWVITAGTDKMHATLPAAQTNSTLVVPIEGLFVGDIVTAVAVGGQVESAGNNVTLVMSVRKQTNAAADNTDAEIGTDNVGTLTADTILSSANLGVTLGTAETVAENEALYVLLTGTTAAATDIDLTHLIVTITQK
jgi:hypothetical protein